MTCHEDGAFDFVEAEGLSEGDAAVGCEGEGSFEADMVGAAAFEFGEAEFCEFCGDAFSSVLREDGDVVEFVYVWVCAGGGDDLVVGVCEVAAVHEFDGGEVEVVGGHEFVFEGGGGEAGLECGVVFGEEGWAVDGEEEGAEFSLVFELSAGDFDGGVHDSFLGKKRR